MVRAAGAAGVAPPAGASSNAPSPYGGPPPPPAPGAGGVGIKRQAGRASGSADPMVMEESSYYGGPPPPPPGAGAIAAQLLTSMLQQTAMAQEAARYAVNEAHLAKALHAHSAEAQRMVIPEAIRPVHNNTIKTILKKVHVRQPVTPAAPTAARTNSQCGPLECRGSRECPCAGWREREHTDGETHRHRSAPVRAS